MLPELLQGLRHQRQVWKHLQYPLHWTRQQQPVLHQS